MARVCNLPALARPYLCAPLAKPLPGATLSGFVNMILNINGKQITVGNKSSPSSNNSVFIKSFSYGGSDGWGFVIELIDTTGGDFGTFLQLLTTDACSIGDAEKYVLIEFGWLIQSCNGEIYKYGVAEVGRSPILDNSVTSHPRGFLVGSIVDKITAENANGLWKYSVTIKDMSATASQTRMAEPIGSQTSRIKFKDATDAAIRPDRNCKQRTLKLRQPKTLFYRRNPNDVISKFGFLQSDGGFDGPKSVWNPDRTDPLTAIRQWTNSLTTDRFRGMFFMSTPHLIEPNIIIMESNQDECLFNGSTCQAQSGTTIFKTYIVNGGDCSPVISFDPKIEFVANSPLGAGMQGGLSTKVIKTRACGDDQTGRQFKTNNTGVQTQVQVPVNNLNWRAPAEAGDRETVALGANAAATKAIETTSVLEADLVIQGDPTYIGVNYVGKFISIIYLNPPAIKSNGFNCEWLAFPTVNQTFSKTNYMIKSVSHQIGEDAKYTTTLKISSVPPNQ